MGRARLGGATGIGRWGRRQGGVGEEGARGWI